MKRIIVFAVRQSPQRTRRGRTPRKPVVRQQRSDPGPRSRTGSRRTKHHRGHRHPHRRQPRQRQARRRRQHLHCGVCDQRPRECEVDAARRAGRRQRSSSRFGRQRDRRQGQARRRRWARRRAEPPQPILTHLADAGGLPPATAVGSSRPPPTSVELAAQLKTDVILMDLSMPVLDGVSATKLIVAADPASRVVILTSFADHHRVTDAIAAGAVGYLLKDSEPQDVLAALRSAASGGVPLDPRVARALLPSADHRPGDDLRSREQQVLRLLVRGLANKQIGRALGISERTVKVHVGSIFRGLGVADRTSAAMWARDNLPADET